MSSEFICPHCGMDFNQPSVQQIVSLLHEDSRRDIYECADSTLKHGSGLYTISYANGQRMPHFTRPVALAVAATGIVTEHETSGWFRRVQ